MKRVFDFFVLFNAVMFGPIAFTAGLLTAGWVSETKGALGMPYVADVFQDTFWFIFDHSCWYLLPIAFIAAVLYSEHTPNEHDQS